jgi:hypothetical protein
VQFEYDQHYEYSYTRRIISPGSPLLRWSHPQPSDVLRIEMMRIVSTVSTVGTVSTV